MLACAMVPTLIGASPGLADATAHWVFDKEHTTGHVVRDTVGTAPVTVTGPLRFRSHGAVSALLVNRDENRLTATLEADAPGRPSKAITVEAWLAIDKTVEWGSVAGIVRGDKGWLLGFRQSSFSFGVSGKEAKGLTHTRARHSLVLGRWYHVAGTYDGKTIRVYVDGQLENESEAQSGEIDYPSDGELVIASFEKFFPRLWLHELRIHDRALSADELAANHSAKRGSFSPLLQTKIGPTLERLDHDTIRIAWDSTEPMQTALTFGDTLPLTRIVSTPNKETHHVVTIDDIDPQRMYYYRLRSDASATAGQSSRLYEFDSTFDYSRSTGVARFGHADAGQDRYRRHAGRVLKDSGPRQGYCLILGCGKGRLATEIARSSKHSVVCIDEDPARVAAERKELDRLGLYGVNASVHQGSLSKLPFSDYFANLIVSETLLDGDALPPSPAEVYRVLRPCGGTAILGQPKRLPEQSTALTRADLEAWFDKGKIPEHEREIVEDHDGIWAVIRRGPLPGAGDWSHQYGDAGNSSCSNDEYVKADMQVLWFGRPGPRPMVDRGTRAPAPLAVNGRLFVQGDRRLFGIDAYNGTIRWTLEIPDLRRANVPRDSSNMAATDDALYVAVRDRCWMLDPDTGQRLAAFPVPAAPDGSAYDWGYVAVNGNVLYGSAVRPGGIFIGADGEWYDKSNEESHKVVSERLFALDRKTGKRLWSYRGGGAVINATVCMGDGQVYMIESRSEGARDTRYGRLGKELATDHYLVALDAATGEKTWEMYYPFHEGRWVFYLSYANDTLVALSTSDAYHVYAFNADDGKPLWQKTYDYNRTHHGGAMQHPVIVGDTVYAEPMAFNLRTGRELAVKLPGRSGCGAMSASAGAVFFRDSYHAMWDLKSNTRTRFTGLRPGCWLGIIPAGGILLAPETSAGCFCAQPIQTSIAFVPKGATATDVNSKP